MTHDPPSVRETAFDCPHCRVLTTQYWYSLKAEQLKEERRVPFVFDPSFLETVDFSQIEDPKEREEQKAWAKMMVKGRPFLWEFDSGSYSSLALCNVSISRCYNCKKVSVWVYDHLVYPRVGEAPPPNANLSEDIRRDYDEASSILDCSPRGAAALIRLAIQKLCKELGKSGKDLNADIGALVKDGLDPRIQQALDIVRVVGNHAVHPGRLDLRDDRATAERLFTLLNMVVDTMISQRNDLDAFYASLPEGALDAIAKRDADS